jgi:hypothetical protein
MKGAALEQDVLRAVFQGAPLPDYGAQLYVSLHTAMPGRMADQTDFEVSTGGYRRIAVGRSASGWSIDDDGRAMNGVEIRFPTCTEGSARATHFAIGTRASGAGRILHRGSLRSAIDIGLNVRVEIPVGGLVIEER